LTTAKPANKANVSLTTNAQPTLAPALASEEVSTAAPIALVRSVGVAAVEEEQEVRSSADDEDCNAACSAHGDQYSLEHPQGDSDSAYSTAGEGHASFLITSPHQGDEIIFTPDPLSSHTEDVVQDSIPEGPQARRQAALKWLDDEGGGFQGDPEVFHDQENMLNLLRSGLVHMILMPESKVTKVAASIVRNWVKRNGDGAEAYSAPASSRSLRAGADWVKELVNVSSPTARVSLKQGAVTVLLGPLLKYMLARAPRTFCGGRGIWLTFRGSNGPFHIIGVYGRLCGLVGP